MKILVILFSLLLLSCVNKDYEKPNMTTTLDNSTIDLEKSSEEALSLEQKEKETYLADEERDEQEKKTPYVQLFCSLYENWWEFFQDDNLNTLVEIALQNNKDITKYIAKFEEAVALAGIAKSQLYPDLNLGVGTSTSKNSSSTNAFGTSGFSVGLMASWEIDLWGQLREASSAALANVKATKLLLDTISLSISNAVANTYFQLIAIQEKLIHLNELYEMLKTNYKFEETKYKSGVSNDNELNKIKNEMLAIQVQIPELEKANYNTKLALKLLLGKIEDINLSKDLPFLVGKTLDDVMMPELPKQIDSRFLLNRPDIISAEHNIVAANHNLNSARDMYFPKIVISASGGYNLNSTTGDGGFYGINLYLFQPIFNRKAIDSQVEQQEAMHKYAIANYEYVVGSAINEGITAILDIDNSDKQFTSSKDMTDQLKKTFNNLNNGYKRGYSSRYDMIKSNVNLKQSEITLIDVKYKQIIARTNFYKVFAGEYKYGNL